jgi:ABC-type glutathione transport system ATPase component
MLGGSVYKDHTFNKETAHLTKTAQYIARIFTVQYKYMNIHSTIQYIYISRIQVHEHYKTQQKTENTEEKKTNILLGKEPEPSNL